MDSTLTYSLLAGLAIVLLFVIARIALRWIFKLAIILIALVLLIGAAWFWFNQSPHPPESKPRPTSTIK